jgi:hypothetical protein
MDEVFSCPDCGTTVQVSGIAPGRQIRCGFCQRLLEVPYLPRVADPRWRRRRFGRPWWVPWAWTALGALAAAIVLVAAVRILQHQQRDALVRSIQRLTDSSELAAREGNLSKALLDLDTAINRCTEDVSSCAAQLERLRAKRHDLAIRDGQSVLDQLKQHDPESFRLGEWLNLRARAAADGDLVPLQPQVEASFQDRLRQRIESDLTTARGLFEAGKPLEAFERCDVLQPFWGHLPPADSQRLHKEAEAIVARIVQRNGAVIDPPLGHFLFGTAAKYNATMVPALAKALQVKGYVPSPGASTWADRWSRAPYHLALQLTERLEGNYMASENRLTRINAHLRLLHHGQQYWETTPTARTTVPLPSLPAYLSTRLALSRDRIEEFERMLYEDARGQIDGKLAFALNNMPAWAQAPH